MSTTLTKEEMQRQAVLPPVYIAALERAIADCFDIDDADEALCARYFRSEVAAVASESELRGDDKLQDDEYEQAAISFLAGWQARQRTEARK
jgi:hypothetical protein